MLIKCECGWQGKPYEIITAIRFKYGLIQADMTCPACERYELIDVMAIEPIWAKKVELPPPGTALQFFD